MAAQNPNAFRAFAQAVELVEHANAAAGEGGQRGAGDAQLGEGPRPKMRQGSRIRLRMFETHNRRMAMAASPAPRKMALLRNSSTTTPDPPSAMRV